MTCSRFCIVLILICLAPSAFAAVGYDSNGFEQPGHLPGTMIGQGWVSSLLDPSTAVIEAGTGISGSQSAVLRDVDTLTSSLAQHGFSVPQVPSAPLITLEADMRIADDFTAGLASNGPAFADIYMNLNTTDGSRLLGLYAVFAGANNSYTTGYALEHSGGATFSQDTFAATPPFTYQNLRLEIDNTAGTLTGFVDDISVVSLNVTPGWVLSITNVGIHMNRVQGATSSSAVYYDNFRLFEGAVPEPTSLALLLPLAGLSLRRRQRR